MVHSKKILALLLALCLTLPAAVGGAGAAEEGTVLYHQLSPSTISEARQVWPCNSTSGWKNPCTMLDGTVWQQADYYNNYSSSGGLPTGETMCVTIPNVNIPTQGYGGIQLALRYTNCPQNGDADIGSIGQFQVYASTDGGTTWSSEYAGLASQKLTGWGMTDNNLEAWVYTVTSTDLSCLVPAGAVINALKIRPYGDSTRVGGATRFQEMTVTGYAQPLPAPDGIVPGAVLQESFEYMTVDEELPIGIISENHLLSGGKADAVVREDASGRYLELNANNTSSSTQAARSRVATGRKSSGTFTVQWDYRRESPVRFDCFLRKNAEIYAMVAESGSVGLNVLNSARVPGVMESQDCGVQLQQGVWYTFKAEMSDALARLSVYRRDTGAYLGGASMPQDTANASGMLEPFGPTFDVWAYSSTANTEKATGGLDNLYIVSGWYEGLHQPEEYVEHAFDRVTFEGSGGTLTVDNFLLDTQKAVYTPTETFDSAALPDGWSGQAVIAASTGDAPLREALRGKTVSSFGDSISTFKGWSNNTAFNPTLARNSVFYPSSLSSGGWLTDAEQTWWLRTARLSGMELLVNNSYSGDKLNPSGTTPNVGLERCTELHNAEGRKPDAILVLFGTNDAAGYSTTRINALKENYETMIQRMKAAYPKAELFLCALLPRTGMTKIPYSKEIKALATKYSARYVDTSLCGAEDMDANYIDGLHPTPAGMALVSDKILAALDEWAGPVAGGRSLTMTDGSAQYVTELGTTADLIFDCKVSGAGTYTVKLGTESKTAAQVELPADMEKDVWYTVRVRTNGTQAALVSTVEKAQTVERTEQIPGDMTGDGKVNGKDITLIQRLVAGGYGVTLPDYVADLNKDGKVNAKDVTTLQRFVAGGYGVTLS